MPALNSELRIFLLLAAAAAAFPFVMQALGLVYYVSFASRVLIYALAASSLNLILGYGGMVSFGHAAFVGAGAYTAAILIIEGVAGGALLAWPLAMAMGALLAGLIGAFVLRTGGVYFIMLTLAFAQMIYYLCVSMKAYGGEEGLNLPGRTSFPGLDLKDDLSFYFVVLALLIVTLLGLRRLVGSRFGHVIQAIRENETRMQAIGFPVKRYKLVNFVIAGAIAALAGALLVNHGNYVSPAMLHWTQSGNLMIMVIIGGVGRQYGGLTGALVLLGIEEFLANYKLAWLAALYPNYQQHSMLGVGILLLLIVLFAPRGLAGLFAHQSAQSGKRGAEMAAIHVHDIKPVLQTKPVLETKGLVKRFGGLLATDHVSLALLPGEIHALIGPNGAGKTTLISQLSGALSPDSGTIAFKGSDVTRLAMDARVRQGLARSYQITSLFPTLSVIDNLALSVQARSGNSFSFWRPRSADKALLDEAWQLSARVGLEARALELAGRLAHGEQRQLEVGLALATRPSLLLLDEPMAGMGPQESHRLVALIDSLRQECAVLLVEHDMDAVFRLADRISVLVSGALIATGKPEAIRNDQQVRRAYLGDDSAVALAGTRQEAPIL